MEIAKARERKEKDKIEFFPYIIDPSVEFTEENIPDWITKEEVYNLKIYTSVRLLSRDIIQKQQEIIYKKHPEIKIRDDLFVGRNNEIELLETKLYTAGNYSQIKAIIVSGRKYIGRRKFLKKFTQSKLNYTKAPLEIHLQRGESIENFILQLNDYLLKYNLKDFAWDTWDKEEKVGVAVELLNEAYKIKQHILIVDDGACIAPSGSVADWFTDILTSYDLVKFIGLFVASARTPKSYYIKDRKDCLFIELHPLSEIDRKNLFYAYAINIGLTDISKEDAIFWITKLQGSPEQIYIAIDSIRRDGRMIAKYNADHIISVGDKSIKEIVDYCKNEGYGDLKLLDIMILLAYLGSISDHMLLKIVGDDLKDNCYKIIDQLHYLSLIEFFGPSSEYIQLDAGISDYIERAGYKLLPRFSERMEKQTQEYLSEPIEKSFETDDLSDYMYKLQAAIKNGTCDSKYLIPSVAIKSIIDLYNREHYNSVISLCEGFLKEGNRIYRDARREINYWLCLALARKLDHVKFEIAIEEMSGLDKLFLKGFFCRLSGDLPAAEQIFHKILTQNSTYTKAARELVTVLVKRHKYLEALDLAKKNYEENPENPYHIEAYYRCLVRKHNITYDDKKILQNLIKSMKTSYDNHHEIIAQTMEAEYMFYIDKKVEPAIMKLTGLNKSEHSLNYTKRALYEIQVKMEIPATYTNPE